jgi:hypothetical protein
MNASLRDLGTRAGAVPAPQLDVAGLVEAGESRIRRRRLAAVAAVTAAVVAVVGGAALAGPGTRRTAPQPAVTDQTTQAPDVVETQPAQRLLTYSVGTTIHWGDRTIEVGQQANRSPEQLKLLDYVDATDDGAVFITGQPPIRDEAGSGLPYGPAAVWFTDGSTPVRIGTTSGSRVRGFGIAPTAEGSTLAWIDPGSKTHPGAVVVYDTAQMRELARLGDADAVPLAVYDDIVYWSPDGSACGRYLWGAAYGCKRTARVNGYETASGRHSRVSTADYEADRRARPGLFTGPSDDPQIRRGVMYLHFVRHGNRLVADGIWETRGVEFIPTVALTGQPLRLRLPAGDRNPHNFHMTQWLDGDRVVLDPHSEDGPDLLVCRLSTGACRLAVHVPDANYTAPGPVVSHG